MVNKCQTYICAEDFIHQGDVFKDVPFFENYKEKEGKFELSVLYFPFAIILSQECDLEQNRKERLDYKTEDNKLKHDKLLISLLCAPLYNAEQLFLGEHLSELKINDLKIMADRKGSDQRNIIKNNREPRYQYIEFEDSTGIVPSVIDFKHYFTLALPFFESNIKNRICSINYLYRELISQRYTNYLSRIGLPENKKIQLIDLV